MAKTKSGSKNKSGAGKSPTKSKKSTAPKEPRAAKPGEEAQHAAAAKPAKPTKTAVKRHPLIQGTYFAKNGEHNGWRLVDATNLPLGRLSSYVANALMGKDKPAFTRFADAGDHVIVINASNVKLTGNKWEDKTYHYHTNYPGGIKTFTARQLLETHPERLVQWAVWGMLPKAKKHMARRWYKKLRVFAGADHPHKAQMPVVAKLPNIGIWEKA